MSETVASLGRSLSNEVVEFIARAVFHEIEGAPAHKVARRMGDVRDVFDGLPVAPLSQSQRDRIEIAAKVFRSGG